MTIKIGDIHKHFGWLCRFTEQIQDGTTFIQVGDFGAGLHHDKELEEDWFKIINEELEERNQRLFVVRGNHDDPSYFKGNHSYSNFKLVPDYHVEEIEGKNYLFLGGSVSIDRTRNIKGVDWWPEEQFDLNWPLLSTLRDINVVIAHNSPSFCAPQTLSPIVLNYAHGSECIVDSKGKIIKKGFPPDTELIGDIQRERMLITGAYQELRRNNPNLEAWYYGHFHFSHTEEIDGVKFKLLNIKEGSE